MTILLRCIPRGVWEEAPSRRTLMHAGEALPRVSTGTSMPDVIHEMSKKAWG